MQTVASLLIIALSMRSEYKIREWQRELDISLRLKPKVDELTERGVTVDWTFAIDPPYLNEDKLDTLLKQVGSGGADEASCR